MVDARRSPPVASVDEPVAGPPELWAGVECTVNRVGDRFFDQIALTGHQNRRDDLDLLASLGAKAVRYPLLWERTAPGGLETADWTWCDDRVARLGELGLRPIAGLVHHGSGPTSTSLIDPLFPEKLAAYARAVAERYPFVEDWTPLNEVVTTARFAGLYGTWYPHGRGVALFTRALLNQCRAVALAMREVRKVNSRARLVHTEDLGRVFSTPVLADQARYENRRRVLALDLLFGRVGRDHPMRGELLEAGASERELAAFEEAPCPPDVVGVNYYLTSDRFLDHRVERYPPITHGGNGRQRYADVEAVRVSELGILGHERLLREIWARYRTTLAITEVHVGCTREEQLRWFHEAWSAAARARSHGVDVVAVTAWSAFGSFDWDKLVTRLEGHYESGLFDIRSDPPRPTVLAACLSRLSDTGRFEHPVAAAGGWWRRPSRVLYGADGSDPHGPARHPADGASEGAPIVVAGGQGTLGQAFGRALARRGLPFKLLSRTEMDISEPTSVLTQLMALQPFAVVNAAGYAGVDEAEQDPAGCFRDNVAGAEVLARVCEARGLRLVTFSSGMVFRGDSPTPYCESAPTGPLSIYGRSQVAAEKIVLQTSRRALIVRTALFFGSGDARHDFVAATLDALTAGRQVRAADDLTMSPTYLPDVVEATLDLLLDETVGVWHLVNQGVVSWTELARKVAILAGLDPSLVVAARGQDIGLVARRPPFSALTSERGRVMRPLDGALAAFVNERRATDAVKAAGASRKAERTRATHG